MTRIQRPTGSITELLRACAAGTQDAYARLWEEIYDAARRIAHRRFRRERPGPLLQPTELVHEVFLEVVTEEELALADRVELWKFLAKVMDNFLCDEARKRLTIKRGGNLKRVDLSDSLLGVETNLELVIAAHEVLDRLEAEHPRAATAYRLSELAGLSQSEVARMLCVSERTVRNYLAYARARLTTELEVSSADE